MTEDVAASQPGSSPDGSSPTVSPVPATIPNAGEEYPHIRKVGRYLFFGMCAVGIALEAYCAARWTPLDKDLAATVANIAGFVAFLALRDMSKRWPQ